MTAFNPGFVTCEEVEGDASTRSSFFCFDLDDKDEVNHMANIVIKKVPLNLDKNHHRLLQALFEMEGAMSSEDNHLKYMLNAIYKCGQI